MPLAEVRAWHTSLPNRDLPYQEVRKREQVIDTTQLMRLQAGIYTETSEMSNLTLILLQHVALSLRSRGNSTIL